MGRNGKKLLIGIASIYLGIAYYPLLKEWLDTLARDGVLVTYAGLLSLSVLIVILYRLTWWLFD